MKLLPDIPLPDPLFTITLSHGSPLRRRIAALAVQLLLHVVPGAACGRLMLAFADGPDLIVRTVTVTVLLLAAIELTVGVRAGSQDIQP